MSESETVLTPELQPIAVVVPCYTSVSTTFFQNFLALEKPDGMPICVQNGVYTPQAMRGAVKELLTDKTWKRLVVVEADMVLPDWALLRHAVHTEDIVGSMYFSHSEPFEMYAYVWVEGKGYSHFNAEGIKTMWEKPGLYDCDAVGMGCTSIARHVLDEWPEDIPMFRNDYKHSARDDWAGGEVSHDFWFCTEARKQGRKVWLDSLIKARHITEGWRGMEHYAMAHQLPDSEASKIWTPNANREQRRKQAKQTRDTLKATA